jgi:hypothetical protein
MRFRTHPFVSCGTIHKGVLVVGLHTLECFGAGVLYIFDIFDFLESLKRNNKYSLLLIFIIINYYWLLLIIINYYKLL